MKKLLILGAGTGGTMMANKMRKDLDRNEWDITIVDEDKVHYYQPAFLFIPFGIYKKEDAFKPKINFLPAGVNRIFSKIEKIDAENNTVSLNDGKTLLYDFLIIATGTRIAPEETPGMIDSEWQKSIFDFYTYDGSVKLAAFLKHWQGGKLVINIADMPIKCPVAPLEFAFLADDYFRKKGMRDNVEIFYVTPLSGAFTKPTASSILGYMLEEKQIHVVPDFYISEVNNAEKKIVDYGGAEVAFDVLVTIPLHFGAEAIMNSGLGDDFGFVKTNKHTLQSELFPNVFVLGDAANLPTSKAGSVVHFSSEVLHENLLSAMDGMPLTASFDGHANCFVEMGNGEAALLDFNYNTEPLTGTFPLPGIGPLTLLKGSKFNHYGKLMFRWIYWHMLLKGKELPISRDMSEAGKNIVA
ncbi:MAG: NAD(P)/FAD-dependent oxidoreductase [Bacteroidetes bacterium]|nr:NAD(P)/FAD-dependent oxidoreductase [Bacteroidota bacterium]MBP7399283.1 NAD(P)/FAD-dependent oxidoreductase [Chitinophagales bacterium]MBK7108315.1 NAD(P)/FAD-dependent oxidoreductase [Bacteroidota bacterium]MBP8754203.1 NAD(P)/FAD-dependent oxidoreductase [Chitinophagales bacterium]MBP9189979.1 NAD(P)/FAD-dependent oxidoreductase [Chitinophagales bacterium]